MLITSLIFLLASNAISLRRDQSTLYSVFAGTAKNFTVTSRYSILVLLCCIIFQANTLVYGELSNLAILSHTLNIFSAFILIGIVFGNLIYKNSFLSCISNNFLSKKYVVYTTWFINSKIIFFLFLSVFGLDYPIFDNSILNNIFTMVFLFLLLDIFNNNFFKSKKLAALSDKLCKSLVKWILGSFLDELVTAWQYIININYGVAISLTPLPNMPGLVVPDGSPEAKLHNSKAFDKKTSSIYRRASTLRKEINNLISLQQAKQSDIDAGLPIDLWQVRISDCRYFIELKKNNLEGWLIERELEIFVIRNYPQGWRDHPNVTVPDGAKDTLARAREILSN